MDTKFKINDKVYFLGDREIFDGEIEGIKIETQRGFNPKISYRVKFIGDEESVKYINEVYIFKTKLECALSLLSDSEDEESTKWVNVFHNPWTNTYYTDSQLMYNTREAAVEAKDLQTLACSTMKYVDTVPVKFGVDGDNEFKTK